MTVRELIARLERIEDKDRVVVMSKDAEGNNYSPLSEGFTESAIYRPDSTWSGDLVNVEDDPKYNPDYEPEKDDQKAVVLWPIN